MTKVRQDAWSHEDDLLLAETVLRHIREGSTQLNAFEEVGDQLNRTSAACGFRWNAEVRSKYRDAIELAKRQRKEKKRAAASQGKQLVPAAAGPENNKNASSSVDTEMKTTSENLTLDSVIQFLKQLNENHHASDQAKKTLEQIEQENDQLRNRVSELESQLTQTTEQLEAVQEDYQVFMQIMDKARKMTVFDQQSNSEAPSFRMDKNGNLEQVADNSSAQ